MKIVYIAVKMLTLPGAMLHAFFEHVCCRTGKVLVDDARTFRTDEMLSHIDHELVKRRGESFNICFFPFLLNLFFGVIFLACGSVGIIYLGAYKRADYWIALYLGISLLTNLFPQMEDVFMLKENIYGKKTNMILKVLASPVFAVIYAGAQLERFGLTLVTSVAAAFGLPYLLGLFVPKIYGYLIAI